MRGTEEEDTATLSGKSRPPQKGRHDIEKERGGGGVAGGKKEVQRPVFICSFKDEGNLRVFKY